MAEPMRPKLLLVGPVPPPEFGVARATELMLHSSVLAQQLDVVHLDTSDRRGVANIGTLDWRNMYMGVKHIFQLERLLRKERPELTLLTISQGTLGLLRDALFVLTSRTYGSQVVAYLRGGGYADIRVSRGRLAAWALTFICRSSSRVVVLSQNLVEMALTVHPKARVAVVPNGCPPAVPPSQTGVREESHPVLVYVGKLSRQKGLEDVLRSVQQVVQSVHTLEFVVAGGWDPPEYKARAEQLIQEYGLAESVHFVGPVSGENKAELLASAWVLVVPSHSEGQPWVILEAMSAGVPVVATDTGAIAETVIDGATGFVVRVGDTEALAERILRIMQDQLLWSSMSEKSLQRHQEMFTLERVHSLLADELVRVDRAE